MKHTRTQALRKLTSARDRIPSLRESSANSPRFQHWNEETLRLILDLFPNDSAHEKAYRELSFGLLFDPHHKAGSHQAEQTYLESLDQAQAILTELLTALGAPGAAPPGASLASDPSDVQGPSDDVVVLHGHDETLLHRITPVIVAAERNRAGVIAWPEDPHTLARQLSAYGVPHMALVLLGEPDLTPRAPGSTDPPGVPDDVERAIATAVSTFGEDKVRVVVQSKISLKPDQVPVRMIRVDTRGQWRAALEKLLKADPT
jgi:hypothetical protein